MLDRAHAWLPRLSVLAAAFAALAISQDTVSNRGAVGHHAVGNNRPRPTYKQCA